MSDRKYYFADNIRFLRNERRMTQQEMADKLQIARSTLNSYENGSIKNPTLDALTMFSNYFQVKIDTLILFRIQLLNHDEIKELFKKYRDEQIPFPAIQS